MIAFILLGVSLIVLLWYFIATRKRLSRLRLEISELRRELEAERATHESERQSLREKVAALEQEIARLSVWKVVADADDEAKAILSRATTLLQEAQQTAETQNAVSAREAFELIAKAKAEAEEILATTLQDTRQSREASRKALDSATERAKEIIGEAETQARQIAGSAYEIKEKADLYEKTVAAMKNIIDGYGDEYMIPERSMLDGLAEDFGHTEAGAQLKTAREVTSAMVRNHTAAICDYVLEARRTTAINFVVDAFNGKVDSILSRVKSTNAGKLSQEIKDAFTLVNYNGSAFRNARITEQFLNARLDELRWAVIVQQLKNDEREEQRRIREQLREEEKARKEFERALRDAAKEEANLKQAIAKAVAQVEKASAEERGRYEEQLRQLGDKLREAEERGQRALSMAQQTKRGHVYIISNIGSFGDDVFKIGLTRRLEPLDRVRELGDSSVPFEFDVHALIFSEDAPALERQLHKHFMLLQLNKINYRKEFFKVGISEIRAEVEKLGLQAKWTMTAAAREYRESLAIEKAIQRDPAAREAWMNRQIEYDYLSTLTDEAVDVLER